jgi:hypothetical protein
MSGTLVKLHTDGTITRHEITGGCASLKQLQDLVGGYVTLVHVMWEGKSRHAYVDEDGESKGLEFNDYASTAFLEADGHHPLVGPMVVWVPAPRVARPTAATAPANGAHS